MMTISLAEPVLLLKLFYKNKRSISTAAPEFCRIKKLTAWTNVSPMIARFEKTGKLKDQPKRGHKHITPIINDVIKAVIVE